MIFQLHIDPDCKEEIIANVHRRTPLIDEIERLVAQGRITDKIAGYAQDEIVMLPVGEIECFVTENEKTFACFGSGKRYAVRKKLYELEPLLPDGFERISRSAIANWKKVVKLKVQFSGAVDAVFKSGCTECISRRCFAELKRRYDL